MSVFDCLGPLLSLTVYIRIISFVTYAMVAGLLQHCNDPRENRLTKIYLALIWAISWALSQWVLSRITTAAIKYSRCSPAHSVSPITIHYFMYCKFINACVGFIWRFSRPPLNRNNRYTRKYNPCTWITVAWKYRDCDKIEVLIWKTRSFHERSY